MRPRVLLPALLVLALVPVPYEALAARPRAKPAEEDPVLQQARDEFIQGTAAVKASQWSEALAHFEKANALKGAPVITFNIGFCQRALGRYVLARRSFQQVLDDPTGMPEAQLEETRTFVEEIDRLLARAVITLDPPTAKIAIDGRPLVPMGPQAPGLLVAGLAPAGEGTAPPKAVFEVVVDPGVHLIQASRSGHNDVLLNKTFAPGAREQVVLKLDELPATLHIDSNQPRAVVVVDDRDVGLTPIDITRPAGRYRIQVVRKGFVTYDTTMELAAGQKANVNARLAPEEQPITKKWWFWGGTAALVAGGITATYLLTRPDPEPPDYQGGSLNWVAQPR